MRVLNIKAIKDGLRSAISIGAYGSNPIRLLKYLPSKKGTEDYSLSFSPFNRSPENLLPIPPQNLWLGYGSNEAEYVESGRVDVNKMESILNDLGVPLSKINRPILDLGCGGGRMIRHLLPYAQSIEIWGLDISAPHINWLKTNLSPTFNFAVNTTIPHLPFPDNYFGLVYCGSVFTHIDDLAETWFLEVRRVLAPGSILFCTLHDESTVEELSKQNDYPITRTISSSLLAQSKSERPDVFVSGRDSDSNVFYKDRYLKNIFSKFFDIKTIVPCAYGYQSAWVLVKK